MMGNSTSVTSETSATAEPNRSPSTAQADQSTDSEQVSRRGFIRAAGATATATAGVATASEASAQTETYRFGGEVQAWRGRAPSAIEGQDNPTIQLEAGQEYEVVWENLDGQPHDFQIQNDEGSNLAGTEIVSQQGATTSFTFTATSEMTTYICTVHPTTMVGDVEVSGEAAGGGQGEGGEQAGGEGTISLPWWSVLMMGAVVLAFISPLIFALFLFSRGGDRGERPAR